MYHVPVLLKESIEALAIKPDGVYVDVTFGGGGHSKEILRQLGEKGSLFGFDQDEDAVRNLLEDQRFTFIPHNFRHLKRYLRLEGVKKVDGILADLGVSGHQFDEAERGFSFRFDTDLDMRMDQNAPLTAQEVLKRYSADELQRVFGEYGEVRNARTLAQAIVKARTLHAPATAGELLHLMEPLIAGKRNRYLAQVFQALRMEVNDESGALRDLLQQCADILNPGGHLVVISYHSLEDRLVKNMFKKGNVEGRDESDIYGKRSLPFKALNSKPIEPSEEEIELNPRARSAKMRVALRIEN